MHYFATHAIVSCTARSRAGSEDKGAADEEGDGRPGKEDEGLPWPNKSFDKHDRSCKKQEEDEGGQREEREGVATGLNPTPKAAASTECPEGSNSSEEEAGGADCSLNSGAV